MIHAFRTTQRVVVCALLSGAVAMAQSAVNKTDSTANKTDSTKIAEHHSKMSKLAFWRHHSDTNTKAKQAAQPTTSKQTKTAQLKPASADQSQIGKAQVRTISAKQPAHNTASTKPPAKKTTAKAPSKKPPEKSTTAQDTPAFPHQGLLKY